MRGLIECIIGHNAFNFMIYVHVLESGGWICTYGVQAIYSIFRHIIRLNCLKSCPCLFFNCLVRNSQKNYLTLKGFINSDLPFRPSIPHQNLGITFSIKRVRTYTANNISLYVDDNSFQGSKLYRSQNFNARLGYIWYETYLKNQSIFLI